MSTATTSLFRKFAWTATGVGATAGIRFALNIVLSRLLAPHILGVMVVVNSVRLGIDLLTDVGIEQNIIHHEDGLDRPFRDTAWTLQVLRGLLLSGVFALAAPLLARSYDIDLRIFLLAACAPALGALHSTGVYALVKKLEVRRRNIFETSCEALAFAVSVTLAIVLRSVWAPVCALVAAALIRSCLSFTLPASGQRFRLDRAIVWRIVAFGKWIALTSLVMYAATNLDRLYLGAAVPMALLGVYGIARAIAELPTTLARRMSYEIIFPALAAGGGGQHATIMAQLARPRLMLTLGACTALGGAAAFADTLIAVLYDPRYLSAGWMLSLLLLGSIFAVLSNLNEALLLGAGLPKYSTFANLMRFATLAIGLPLGIALAGFPGAVVAVAATELFQYGYSAVGLRLVGLGFWRQDSLACGTGLALFAALVGLRVLLGLGSPLHGFFGALA